MLHIYVTSYTCYSKLQVTHLRLPELHFYTEVMNDNILSRSCSHNSHADPYKKKKKRTRVVDSINPHTNDSTTRT